MIHGGTKNPYLVLICLLEMTIMWNVCDYDTNGAAVATAMNQKFGVNQEVHASMWKL